MRNRKGRMFKPRNINGVEEQNGLFDLQPIIINIIAIIILVGAYFIILQKDMFDPYLTYIYWTVNVLVSYNIIAASARSLLAPLLALGISLVLYYALTKYGVVILSIKELWQLFGLAIVGFFLTLFLKL